MQLIHPCSMSQLDRVLSLLLIEREPKPVEVAHLLGLPFLIDFTLCASEATTACSDYDGDVGEGCGAFFASGGTIVDPSLLPDEDSSPPSSQPSSSYSASS